MIAGGPLRTAAAAVRERFGTPTYVYDRAALETAVRSALAFPAPFGFTLRYAMKANPNQGILTLFRELGRSALACKVHFNIAQRTARGQAPNEP